MEVYRGNQGIQFGNLLSFVSISSFTKSEKIFDNREDVFNVSSNTSFLLVILFTLVLVTFV